MNSPNYHQHEVQYRLLLKNGFLGWGGENFDRRMQGWNDTVESLISSAEFPKSGSKILEVGTGAGDSLIPFAEKGYDVTGVDISPTAIDWARDKFATRSLRGEFKVTDLSVSIPFEEGAFDAVIDAACLHCLIGPDRVSAFREVARVLRPDGFFLVSHMVNDPIELSKAFSFDPTSRTQLQNGIPYRSMPRLGGLRDEVISAGFKIIKETIRQNAWWDHTEMWCRK